MMQVNLRGEGFLPESSRQFLFGWLCVFYCLMIEFHQASVVLNVTRYVQPAGIVPGAEVQFLRVLCKK